MVVVAASLFGACGSTQSSAGTPSAGLTVELTSRGDAPPASMAAPVPAPAPSMRVDAEPAPAPTTAQPPALKSLNLVDSPGDTRLEAAVAHLVAGKSLEARRALQIIMPEIDGAATLDVRLAAHALLGRSCAALKDAACAKTQFELVTALWKDPPAGATPLADLPGDDDARRLRMARALTAVGEALYHQAEGKRLLADKERVPVYKGKGDRESLLKHVNTKTRPWVDARRKLIEEAEKAYVEIARLPSPPPYWVVAAASRVGQMWGAFVAEFRAAPIPKEWLGTGVLPKTELAREEVRATYYAVIDEASEPQKHRARAAFEMCQDIAKKWALENEHSAQCDAWLKRHPKPPSP